MDANAYLCEGGFLRRERDFGLRGGVLLGEPFGQRSSLDEGSNQRRRETAKEGQRSTPTPVKVFWYGSNLKSWAYAGFSVWFHLPRCHFGIPLF